MIEGIFKKKYFGNIISLLCGLFLIGLFVFLGFVDSEATNNDLSGIVFGAIICIFSTIFLFFNFKAFVHIDENHIKGKYNWFGKIDCGIADVEFASAQSNTLTIKLKNGKRHIIMGIENSFELCSVIRRNMPFEVTDTPKVLFEKINRLKESRKKSLLIVCFGIALMFINIFLTVFFTGGRELYEFSKTDWIIMAVMGVVEIITVIGTFCYGNISGKKNHPIEQLKYTLQRTIIEKHPLPVGNIKMVYADNNYTGRAIVFEYPNDSGIYYSVQKLDSNYILETVYTSEVYEDEEDFLYDFESFIDITDRVYH